MEHSAKMSKPASPLCDMLCRYLDLEGGEFGWRGTFSKLIHKAHHIFFLWHTVSLMCQHHFLPKEGGSTKHDSSAFSIVQLTQLLILVAKGLGA